MISTSTFTSRRANQARLVINKAVVIMNNNNSGRNDLETELFDMCKKWKAKVS